MRFALSLNTDTFPLLSQRSQTFSNPHPKIFTKRLIGISLAIHLQKTPIFHLPQAIPLSRLLPTTTSPFQNLAKTTTSRTVYKKSIPLPQSLLLSKHPQRLLPKPSSICPFIVYHCRNTQQLRVGKGHTSERLVSTCLIFVNFFSNLAQNFISVLGLYFFFLQNNVAEPGWEKSDKRETEVSSCFELHLHFFS